jgi:hypothetical protein
MSLCRYVAKSIAAMHNVPGALLLAMLMLYGGCAWWLERPVRQAPGVLAAANPAQTAVSDVASFEKGGYALKPLARYEIRARVLGKERYRFDAGADLVPYDIAVGWGRMSDTAVLDAIDISQDGRFYYWRTAAEPIPLQEISLHSANMHLIGADKQVMKQIARLRPGQIVSLRGYLVEARHPNGFFWPTSLTRADTGGGACELMWVEDIRVD